MSVLFVLIEFLLKQIPHFDAEVTQHLKEIKAALPSLVALCSKLLVLLIEVVGLFRLGCPKSLDENRAQLVYMLACGRSIVRYGEEHVAQCAAGFGRAHG